MFDSFVSQLGRLDRTLSAYGLLDDPYVGEKGARAAECVIRTHFTSAALWILEVAKRLEGQVLGALVVLDSITAMGRQRRRSQRLSKVRVNGSPRMDHARSSSSSSRSTHP
jgi:hypothetical protein